VHDFLQNGTAGLCPQYGQVFDFICGVFLPNCDYVTAGSYIEPQKCADGSWDFSERLVFKAKWGTLSARQ
jgi:hypothetical protein